MYLILSEIFHWIRIWFQNWCATNGSLAITKNGSFLNKMFQSVQKWHILSYSKRTVCRTSIPKPDSDSVKNFWKIRYMKAILFYFWQKISKNVIYVGFLNIVCRIFNFDGSYEFFAKISQNNPAKNYKTTRVAKCAYFAKKA